MALLGDGTFTTNSGFTSTTPDGSWYVQQITKDASGNEVNEYYEMLLKRAHYLRQTNPLYLGNDDTIASCILT